MVDLALSGQHCGPVFCVSLAGAATSTIFVATKHVFCRDKSMLVATKLLSSDFCPQIGGAGFSEGGLTLTLLKNTYWWWVSEGGLALALQKNML